MGKNESVERQGIIHFSVKDEGINRVMTGESFDGETIFLIVLFVQVLGVLWAEFQMSDEEFV